MSEKMKDTKCLDLVHKEYHWKGGIQYILEYFRTETGIKSRVTKVSSPPENTHE